MNLIQERFHEVNVKVILAINIPQRAIKDRIAWSHSADGQYTVKTIYKLWHNQNMIGSNVVQDRRWSKIWRLAIPHKMKIFLWICMNNIPVRNRLRTKGVHVTIIYPMCCRDIEHMFHMFFDCQFAVQCWFYAGLALNTSMSLSTPEWLVHKSSTRPDVEIYKIVTVLWGICYWRNKKV